MNNAHTNTNTNTDNARTLEQGINGSGHTVWIVVTWKNGGWHHAERFTCKGEALNWMRWA